MRNLIECNNVIPQIFIISEESDTDAIISKRAAVLKVDPSYIVRLFPEKDELTVEQVRDMLSMTRLSASTPSLIAIFALDASSAEVQNMLLKTLEETSSRYHFILFVKIVDRLLPTIRSRCIVISDAVKTFVQKTRKQIDPVDYFSMAGNSDISREEAIKKIDEYLVSADLISLKLAKYIMQVRSLIQNNNVDPSMGLDGILLFCLKTSTMKNIHGTT